MKPPAGLPPFAFFRLALFIALLAAAAGAQGQAQCTFRTPAPTNIVFSPALDPSSGATRTAFSNMRIRCTAPTSINWSFSGANGSAPLRMKHATLSEFIPYTVAPTYVSGGTGNQSWRVTATILPANYVNAREGTYSDVLTASILP
jgi:hypothetical protein